MGCESVDLSHIAPPVEKLSAQDAYMKNLRTWHITLGGFTQKVSPFEMEDGVFDMVAVEDVTKDDVVAFIPAELIMTVQLAKERSTTVKAL